MCVDVSRNITVTANPVDINIVVMTKIGEALHSNYSERAIGNSINV